jgi:hypothetical protein
VVVSPVHPVSAVVRRVGTVALGTAVAAGCQVPPAVVGLGLVEMTLLVELEEEPPFAVVAALVAVVELGPMTIEH